MWSCCQSQNLWCDCVMCSSVPDGASCSYGHGLLVGWRCHVGLTVRCPMLEDFHVFTFAYCSPAHALQSNLPALRIQACAAELAAWLAQGGPPQPLHRVVAALAAEPSLAAQGPTPLLARCVPVCFELLSKRGLGVPNPSDVMTGPPVV